MTNQRPRCVSSATAIVSAAMVLLCAAAGRAQLSTPTFTNSSNPDETVPGTATTPSRERESFVDLVSSPAGSFTTRYISLVTVDGDGAGAGAGVESLASDYEVDFTATAPGAYTLAITTSLSGDMHLVNDGSSATADVGPITGTSTGGTVTAGSLDIADPGIVGGAGGGSSAMADGSSASVFGVSNGSPVAHNLHFVFTQIATSAAGGGDEAAIRLGGTSDIASETAGDYPGSPARTQADDGHVVTVTFTSLCGNSVLDSGPSYAEDCDDGANNGQPGSCCNADCTFATVGSPCDDGDACTVGDGCSAGACVAGTALTCPLCQTCDGGSGCIMAPRPNCKLVTAPLQAKFQLKDKPPPSTSDLVLFKWSKGDATQTVDFGSPPTTDDYALCVFNPGLALKLDAPAGGTCPTNACWKTVSIKGFNYKDKERTPNGVDKIVLKAGLAGKAKVQLKGKGANLPALPLPLTLPATVQLQSESGQCWQGTFSASGQTVGDSTQFKGRGQ
jgi:hypothetical protein